MSEPPIPGMFSSEDTDEDIGGAEFAGLAVLAGLVAAVILGISAALLHYGMG